MDFTDIFMSEKQADVALDFSIPGRQASLRSPMTPDPCSQGSQGSPSPPAASSTACMDRQPEVQPASPPGGDTARSLHLDAILDSTGHHHRSSRQSTHAHAPPYPRYEPHLALPGTLPGATLADYTMRLMRAFPSSFLGQKAGSRPMDVYNAASVSAAAAKPTSGVSQSVFCEPTLKNRGDDSSVNMPLFPTSMAYSAGACSTPTAGSHYTSATLSPDTPTSKGSGSPPGPLGDTDPVYWERRRKNNEAAKRSRDARRAKEDEISLRASMLEQENLRLKVEVATLKTETNKLRWLLYNS